MENQLEMFSAIEVLGNQADAVIRWKLLEYFISI